ncbi:MAG: KH domain-containing protein [Candidatus Heimdallarchaeota archaeon]
MVIECHVKIPRSRIGVLIGRKGEVKDELESITKMIIQVDSGEGSVHILATENTPDPILVWTVRDIVRAIGRGFSPSAAFNLLDDDIFLETIDLEGSKSNIKRLKSRIIGEKGKAKRMIETSTETVISVFGNQVSIIGELTEIQHAREAIQHLIQGSKHSTVFRYLEQLRFRSKYEPLRIWKDKPRNSD